LELKKHEFEDFKHLYTNELGNLKYSKKEINDKIVKTDNEKLFL
jgi:hypothetical protein